MIYKIFWPQFAPDMSALQTFEMEHNKMMPKPQEERYGKNSIPISQVEPVPIIIHNQREKNGEKDQNIKIIIIS